VAEARVRDALHRTPSPTIQPTPTASAAGSESGIAPEDMKAELSADMTAEIDRAMEGIANAGLSDAGAPRGPAQPSGVSDGSSGSDPDPADPHDLPGQEPDTPGASGAAAGATLAAASNPHAVKPIGGPAKAALRGPRKVEAGREMRTGMVVSVGPTDIFIEFGPKELGVLERNQFKEGDELPVQGQPYEVVVQRYNAEESIYICVRPGVVQKADWELLRAGQIVEALVTGVNKGGLDMEVAQHRAFLPASQVSLERVEDLTPYIGQKLACEVQRIERGGKGNIVLSRRGLLAKEREEASAKLKDQLNEGQTIEGTVKRLADFGAFVDIGGMDGLIHLSDLSHDRVGHGQKAVEKHVKVGQKVNVQILKIDWDQGRIGLGLKQLQADPFKEATGELTEGAEVTGRVKRLTEFGAFIEVAPGVEGLCHISELEWRRVRHPSEVVKEDEVVQVKILKIDPDSRKLSLSLKALKESPRSAMDKKAEEIRGEDTRQLRRMREEHQKKSKQKATGKGGLGDFGGMGLGDLKF
ncbi:MAG: S1 RNA-binding domain-containing protein, partial [Planctomycetota bacterium]